MRVHVGPVDDMTIRMLLLVGGAAVFALVVETCREIDGERQEKPRKFLLRWYWEHVDWNGLENNDKNAFGSWERLLHVSGASPIVVHHSTPRFSFLPVLCASAAENQEK